MEKKPLITHKRKYLEIASKAMSFHPVKRNGWWIKLSTLRQGNVLLLFTSSYTGQTIIRYFIDEDEAVEFINFVTDADATEYLEHQ